MLKRPLKKKRRKTTIPDVVFLPSLLQMDRVLELYLRRTMTSAVEENAEKGLLKKYNDAIQSNDRDKIDEFWSEIAEGGGYTKAQLIDSILDDYNQGKIEKASLDYYMSTLAQWQGR